MELVDIVDKDNNVIGVADRADAHRNGDWHRVVHIWLYSNSGLYLQKRSPSRKVYPNIWDISAAGHVSSGENPNDAAVRELKEELGICRSSLEYHYIQEDIFMAGDNIIKEIAYVYFVELGCNDMIIVDRNEVSVVEFISYRDLFKSLVVEYASYVPREKEYWRVLFHYIEEVLLAK